MNTLTGNSVGYANATVSAMPIGEPTITDIADQICAQQGEMRHVIAEILRSLGMLIPGSDVAIKSQPGLLGQMQSIGASAHDTTETLRSILALLGTRPN